MKASIALQVLPLSQGIDRIEVIDQVIAYLQVQGDNVFANVKINVGEILSIDEKLEKYDETSY